MGVFDFETAVDTDTDNDGANNPHRNTVAAYLNDSSMTMTVPHKISDSVGIETGDPLLVTETENGFTVEVIDSGD